jgi:anti-sigma factor RsiW
MSESGPTNPADREAEINALLDGELDAATAADLKAAAAADSALAQAIVQAWQLQQGMDQLQLEKAPASLSRKLRRIPREQAALSRRAFLGMPRWAAAAGLASVVLVTVVMVLSEPSGQTVAPRQQAAIGAEIDPARVREARRELSIAFSYLDKAGFRVSRQIQEVLSEELAAPVKDNLSKHIPYTGQSHKEKQA